MSSVKDEMTRIIQEQPDDSSFDEIVRELAFARIIDRGLQDSEAGRTVTNDEIRRQRYTERARHVIFVARVEAISLGSMAVETEHLLLGLLQDTNLTNRFGSSSSVERVRVKIKQRIGPKDGPSIDIPLSIECERVLADAAQEAERLNHPHIGTEHLLLGILRQDLCGAAQILKEVGFDLGDVREQLARSTTVPPIQHSDIGRFLVPDAETAARRAEAAWTAHFDAATIESQRPFKVEQRFAVWIVSGSAPPESALFAFIAKTGGWILAIGLGEQGRRWSYS